MVDSSQTETSTAPYRDFLDDHEPVFPLLEKDKHVEFLESLQTTIQDYHDMVIDQLPPTLDRDGKPLHSPRELSPEDIDESYHPYDPSKLEMAETGFAQWSDNSFKQLRDLCQKPDDMSALTAKERRRIDLQTDLRHDLASDILGGFAGALTSDDYMYDVLGYYGNPYMVEWPLHIMDRIYKQTTDQPDIKTLHGQYANRFMYAVFRTLSIEEKDRFKYDIDYQTPFEVEGDFDYLLGVLANPLNNIKQIAKEKAVQDVRSMIRVIPDPDQEGHVLIQIRDNIGGMPGELLEVPEGSKIQKALQRGETRRKGGTGAGLAIVNEIVTDHFHGSISLKNEAYPETNQQGLVMNISLPGKLLGDASE